MNRKMLALMAALIMATMISGGCASKEAVKPEEAVVKTDTSVATAKPIQQPSPKSEAIQVVPAQQAPVQSQAANDLSASSLATIYFDFDKSDLSKDARDILNKNAQVLLKSKASVKIEGHCDERGSAEYNLALGERRAKSAQQYLLTLGVQPDRLSVISYGKEKPAVQGNDETAWSKNRRDEFVLVK